MTKAKIYSVYIHKWKDGRVYIGKTVKDPEIRWNRGEGYINSKNVYAAIKEVGWDNIEHIILARGLSREEACYMESALIAEYGGINHPLVLNVQSGGDYGYTISEDAKEEIRQLAIERYKNNPQLAINAKEKNIEYYKNHPEAVEKARKNTLNFHKEHPERGKEHGEYMKKYYQDHPELAEQVAKRMKEFYKNHPELVEAARERASSPVRQFSKKGEYIATYKSIKEASKITGIDEELIFNSLGKASNTGGGYIWKYDDGKVYPIIELDKRLCPIYQICQYTGSIVNTFESIVDASAKTGIHRNSISNCLAKRSHTAGGYIWKYVYEREMEGPS